MCTAAWSVLQVVVTRDKSLEAQQAAVVSPSPASSVAGTNNLGVVKSERSLVEPTMKTLKEMHLSFRAISQPTYTRARGAETQCSQTSTAVNYTKPGGTKAVLPPEQTRRAS